MATFNFRLRFILAPRDAFGLPESSATLMVVDERHALQLKAQDQDKPIKEVHELVITGHTWDTEHEAREAGLKTKFSMMLALAGLRMGADFGDRRSGSFFYPPGLQMLEKKTGQRVLNNVHGLMVFESDPSPLFASVGEARVTRTMQPERISATFYRAYQSNYVPTETESLAFELYNASFFERTPRTRFLSLVMAVETLLQPKDRTPNTRRHVEHLIEQTKECANLTKPEKDSMVGALRWLLQESITKTGTDLAAERLGSRTYMELDAPKFFKHCYTLRSKMVHGEGVRGDEAIVGVSAAELERFVADLLAGHLLGFDL